MSNFVYRALRPGGKSVTGRIDAGSQQEAREKLRETGLNPIEVTMASTSAPTLVRARQESAGGRKKAVDLDQLRLSRAKADALSLAFLEKLHQLLDNGLPLGDAVKSLHQRLTDPTLHAVAGALWKDLSEGATLAVAMGKRPALFDTTLASMVEAGEATGNLEPILANIVQLIRSRITLRKNIMAGLSYPAFILVVVFFVLLFVLFYLMPRVQEMLDSMGGDLSLAAKAVVFFASSTLTLGPFALFGCGIVALAVYQWRKAPEGRLATDQLLLRIPAVREVILDSELSRLSNLAAILLGSGVDTVDALKLLEKTFKNEDLRGRFRACRALINDGASFSDALQTYGILVNTDADVLAISENTGSLVKGFRSIYQNRYESLENEMKRLTVLTSTVSLLFVFVLVFLLVFGVVSSIMQLSNSVLGG